jgi:flagellar assembly protein FliH
MTNQPQPERRPRIIKANEPAAPVARQVILDKFDPSQIQVTRNPTQRQAAEHQKGYEEGYQEGLAQARADVVAATEDSSRRVRNALAALSEAVAGFDNRETVALADVEDAIVAGAFALARSILQRELITATDPGGDALARALQLAPDRGDVIAHLHPNDLATLNMDRITSPTRSVQLVANPSVELGGCMLEVGEMRIDAQLSSALQHAARAMSVDSSLVEEIEEPLVDEDVAGARMEAAIAALQNVASGQEFPLTPEPEAAVIEGTEAQRAPKSKANAGSARKSSRKTASEAP